MSLKSVHLLFISLASLLAFGFGIWCLRRGEYSALGLMAILLGVGLVAYGMWFVRKIRTPDEERRRRRARLKGLLICVPLWLLSFREALACRVCYGDAEGPMIDAARTGVWALFGLVLVVQLLFALFFVNLWVRARRQRGPEPATPPRQEAA
jgi:membrane protein implicated in regulation of membrane protease activity